VRQNRVWRSRNRGLKTLNLGEKPGFLVPRSDRTDAIMQKFVATGDRLLQTCNLYTKAME
jgi:hypothetical protein